MREQSASRINLKLNKVLALVSAFAIGLGAFCLPMKTYAFMPGGYDPFKRDEFLSYEYGEFGQMSFCQYNVTQNLWGYYDCSSSTTTVDSSIVRWRIWVHFGEVIPAGSYVDLSFNLLYATGSIENIDVWFGVQQDYTHSTLRDDSDSYKCVAYNYPFWASDVENSIYILNDTSSLCLDITMNRSNSDMYLRLSRLTMNYQVDSGDGYIYEEEQEQTTTQKNIFEVIGDIFTNITNLPNAIKTSLTTLFTNVQNAVNNVASGVTSGLSGFFTNVQNAVNNVASGVTSGLSGFFEDIIGTGIVDGSFFDNFQSEAEKNATDIDDALANAPDVLKPSIEELPDFDEFLPEDDNFLVSILDRLFSLEIVQTACLCSLTFACIGYIMFGKR